MEAAIGRYIKSVNGYHLYLKKSFIYEISTLSIAIAFYFTSQNAKTFILLLTQPTMGLSICQLWYTNVQLHRKWRYYVHAADLGATSELKGSLVIIGIAFYDVSLCSGHGI